MQFIDLQTQYQLLKERIDNRIQTVLDHGKFIKGPEVLELEEKLSEYVDVKHTITCANGTDAIQLALMALNIKAGDAVFCPTFTFFASAEAIAIVGATPIFIDSDEKTFNMCPNHLEKQIIRTIEEGALATKAILAVDLFGLPANYPEIQKIADKYELKIIEDAAQGFGGSINGKRAGSFGDIATTSFFPAKPLGCYGDGGAVFTNNDELAAMVRSLHVHGKGFDKYDNVRIGINSRLDTIQAAILLEKLSEFPRELALRQMVADSYSTELCNKFFVPFVPEGYLSSWAQYTIYPKEGTRDAHMMAFKDKGVPTVVYYRTNMHEQTAFKYLGYNEGDFPIAEKHAKSVFSVPMHPYLKLSFLKP